jgi:hypothetical protein
MDDDRLDESRRIAIELGRLDQEVRVIQHVLDDAGVPNGADEMIRMLRHLASRAERIAALVESAARSERTTA